VVRLEDVDVSKFASLGGFFPTTVKRLEIG
jgi:uncharacterized protein (UPF0303 family)